MEGKAPRMYARQYSPRQAYYSTSRSTENRCYEKKFKARIIAPHMSN